MSAASQTRSATSTTTSSRVNAVLDLFFGDLVAFVARKMLGTERAKAWLRDLTDALVMEAVERFQVKITLPNGKELGLDYEVSDDGSLRGSDTSGGFSTSLIPADSNLALVLRWRADAPRVEEARTLLRSRGWGVGSLLETAGAPERAYADNGYGLKRRFAGDWE